MTNSSHTMKTGLLLLLVSLLCAEKAQGLSCYQCMGAAKPETCQPATCPNTNNVCVTQEVESTVESYKVTLINKFCYPTCPDKEIPGILEGLGIPVNSKISCCNTDLCNAAGATGGSIWTLAGVLLFSLGSVLLQAWL
ncbi:lymphocyte antigen 6S isoform X2 [Microtus pennsylvanicus]|uniref:lymphocyte antigen 6S isoform X1 n=1 Tax=Microtus pennsylvanicus TaxID=10058 RepID=UPI003F6B9E65